MQVDDHLEQHPDILLVKHREHIDDTSTALMQQYDEWLYSLRNSGFATQAEYEQYLYRLMHRLQDNL